MKENPEKTEDIYEIRRQNLRILATEHETQKEFSEKMKTSPSLLSQMIGRRKNDKGKSKNIGRNKAREFERLANKEPGWLDKIHLSAKPVQLPVVNLNDLPEDISTYRANWMKSMLQVINENKQIIGNSDADVILLTEDNGMAPNIESTDIIFAKTGSGFSGEGIYAIDVAGHRYIRHVNYNHSTDEYIVKGVGAFSNENTLKDVIFLARVKQIWKRQYV